MNKKNFTRDPTPDDIEDFVEMMDHFYKIIKENYSDRQGLVLDVLLHLVAHGIPNEEVLSNVIIELKAAYVVWRDRNEKT